MDKKTQYVNYGKIKEDLEQHYSTAKYCRECGAKMRGK